MQFLGPETVFFEMASHLFVNITTDEQKGNFLCYSSCNLDARVAAGAEK